MSGDNRPEGDGLPARQKRSVKATELKKQILSSNSFAIAEDVQVWHRANARIKDDPVIVSSPEVETPVAVRYA